LIQLCSFCSAVIGNSLDKLCHPRSDAFQQYKTTE